MDRFLTADINFFSDAFSVRLDRFDASVCATKNSFGNLG